MREVLEKALALVTPSGEEEKALVAASNKARDLVSSWVEARRIEADVQILGSSARGTWLPGQRDIDVFVVVRDRSANLEALVRDLAQYLESLGLRPTMRYAQHPYVSVVVDEHEVDIVPCYKIEPGERPITAADRSPLHHAYLSRALRPEQKGEVRLLKQFLRGIGVYGAEIKVEGFSGYLTELLIVHYGSFLDVLEAASKWRPYKVVLGEPARRFKAPLVVVDPVDPYRNAAAAVSITSMSTFILAARRFLKRPSLSYFTPPPAPVLPIQAIEIRYPYPGEPPDVTWGRYKHLARTLRNWLRECGFNVYRYGVESDENTYISLVYVLDRLDLPPYVLHKGPPVYDDAVDAFVEKYLNQEVVGPFVMGSRAYVIKRRRFANIEDCLKAKLGGGYELRPYRGPLVAKNSWLT